MTQAQGPAGPPQPPPPPGGVPYGGGMPPQQGGVPGQPGAPQPGMPQQGGVPQAPPFPQGPPVPSAPKKGGKLARILVSVVVAVVVAGFFAWLRMDDAVQAKVGDCVAGASADEMEIVKCDTAGALKVVGRVENRAEGEMQSACQAFPTAESAFWEGKQGQTGTVLCLASVK